MKDVFELLSILDKFNIEKTFDGDYKISTKGLNYDGDLKDIIAIYRPKTGAVKFQMTDIYNNGNDVEDINQEQIQALHELINLLKEFK